ncbi:MAG: GGDEF domain-containing protein [Polyangiaceae bacterium]
MIDLDDFKRVNDRHGHLAGDALLAGLGRRLRAVLRAGESPFRYGGEEFAVLLPGVSHADLAGIGERLRRAVAGAPFPVDAERRLDVTCSVGLTLSEPEDDTERFVERADRALFDAKHAGKNRVVVA